MAEHQKIHPVDVEAAGEKPPTPAATAPLMPHGTAVSDKGDPLMYPPQIRTFPVAHSKPPKRRRSCFCRCICWSLCLILLFIVLLGITAGALYLIYRPKLPRYSVEHLRISSFNISDNVNLTASFNVTVNATNPNDKIGIYYVDGSHLSVWYLDTNLCEGELPVFYQGHHNTTVLYVIMTGETQLDGGILTELQAAQKTGEVPLKLRGTVPVRVKFGGLKLFKVKFLVRCSVVVGSLIENEEIDIKSSHCKFKFRL